MDTRARIIEEGGVKHVVGDRATGRTTALLQLAADMQQEHDQHTTIIISPYYQRANFVAGEVMHWIELWFDTDGERGLDPARTIVDSPINFAQRNRGKWWAMPDGHVGPHHVFAFLDDTSEFRSVDLERFTWELSALGIVLAAVVL